MREIFREFMDEREKSFSPDKLHDFIDYYLKEMVDTTDPNSSFYQENASEYYLPVLKNKACSRCR